MAMDQKKMQQLMAHLILLDESGFLLTPNVKRTWAPRGKTPIHYHVFSREKISAISALAVSPQRKHLSLYTHLWRNDISTEEVIEFLKPLLRHLRGNIIILWDRASIHKSKLIDAFLKKHPRVKIEEFPAYAPELNPAEYVWNQSDNALSNTSPEGLDELEEMLTASIRKTGGSQKLLWACIRASELPWK